MRSFQGTPHLFFSFCCALFLTSCSKSQPLTHPPLADSASPQTPTPSDPVLNPPAADTLPESPKAPTEPGQAHDVSAPKDATPPDSENPSPPLPPPAPSDPVPSPEDPHLPIPLPQPLPQVIKGWLDEYSQHIEQEIRTRYVRLKELTPNRMDRMCPHWEELDEALKTRFWSALLWSIAGPESARNRTLIFTEHSLGTDPVTGYPVHSEGLLQLSYQDVRNYRYDRGDISWEKDRDLAIEDYENNALFGNPDRTLLSAYANLNLGLFIMNRLVTVSYPQNSLEEALGKYWYTMRPWTAPFGQVMLGMGQKIPECYGLR